MWLVHVISVTKKKKNEFIQPVNLIQFIKIGVIDIESVCNTVFYFILSNQI